MDRQNTIQQYFETLKHLNVEKVVEFFTPSGMINTPLYGTRTIASHYEELFSKTKEMEFTVKGIYQNVENPDSMTAHVEFTWTLNDGSVQQGDLVDLFHFAPNSDKIESLQIVIDTFQIKPALAKAGS
ncbi:MAG: hypothetical protein K940chlam9_01828 [Chlamydiae bacterium]|nr:hypothetical protein [Chlamydiota bacterium]